MICHPTTTVPIRLEMGTTQSRRPPSRLVIRPARQPQTHGPPATFGAPPRATLHRPRLVERATFRTLRLVQPLLATCAASPSALRSRPAPASLGSGDVSVSGIAATSMASTEIRKAGLTRPTWKRLTGFSACLCSSPTLLQQATLSKTLLPTLSSAVHPDPEIGLIT